MSYNSKGFEKKWQDYWEKNNFFRAEDPAPYGKPAGPKKYILIEFPYPSGDGLHVGHARSYVALDTVARKKRMEGYNVLFPIGWDAFGLPTENYAIKTGIHPQVATEKNIANYKRQIKNLGLSFDWSREINTTDPEYYKWTQWIFLKLFEKGLAYQAEIPINWCPSCKTGLANEEVVEGKCERCGMATERKILKQWMVKITKYADRLIDDLKYVDFPEKVKAQQINWIGRSEGTEILFGIEEMNKKIKIVTTRADTIFGATFLVLAPEHGLIQELKEKIKNWREVEKYIRAALKKNEFERGLLAKEKTGVRLEGVTAINPANGHEIPIYISDFVLITYGTGAIMSVPAHDNRDFEFAKKFSIPIIKVIKKPEKKEVLSVFIYDEDVSDSAHSLRKLGKPMEYITPTVRAYDIDLEKIDQIIDILKRVKIGSNREYELIKKGKSFTLEVSNKTISFVMVYMGDGEHINSDFLNGLNNEEAIVKMTKWLLKRKLGKSAVHYHLRDWVFSRQHYWGEPIPIIHCQKCGPVPVLEKDLPVRLPYVEKYQPTGTGESPLAAVSDWVNVKCPKCGGEAKRETDTMPNWAGSNWYHLAYLMRGISNFQFPISKYKKVFEYWMPVDWYNGGMEHTTLHLLYSRFIYKFLFDIGVVPQKEPYSKRTSQGIVLAEDGKKMSKSFGNVINPDEIVEKYGADTLRVYEMFMGPFGETIAWSTQGVRGVYRFLEKVWRLVSECIQNKESSPEILRAIHKLNKKIDEDLEATKFNTAVAAFMEFINLCQERKEKVGKEALEYMLTLLYPFAPHISEELWRLLGQKESISFKKWPKYDPKLIKEETITLVIQVNGKVRDKIEVEADISEEKARTLAISREKVKNRISDKDIKKIVFVPGKLINIVTK